MACTEGGELVGSISGGCIEGAVIEAALSALETGTGQRLDFGVADETAWEVGLSCGGKIAVLVTPVVDGGLPAASLKSMANDIAARRPVAISFDPVTGAMLDTGDSGSQSRSPRNRDMSGRQSGLSDDGSCFEFIELRAVYHTGDDFPNVVRFTHTFRHDAQQFTGGIQRILGFDQVNCARLRSI